jgi:hypothetical protein
MPALGDSAPAQPGIAQGRVAAAEEVERQHLDVQGGVGAELREDVQEVLSNARDRCLDGPPVEQNLNEQTSWVLSRLRHGGA